jgi:K+/H+ antiporter YhaU regulatory subunit KhtT
MRTSIDRLTLLKIFVIFVPVLALVACGGHASPTAPSNAPSTLPPPAAPATSGATIVGTVSGSSGANRAGSHILDASSVTVTVAGTAVSATVDAAGTFTLTDVPPIQVVLNFAGPGVNAALPLGMVAANDHLQISVTVAGTTATLNTQPQVSMTGSIAAIAGACPSLSLSVGGATIQTSVSTSFNGKSCSDLVVGDSVGVVGTRQSDGVVHATTIETTQTSPPPTPTPPTPTPPPAPVPVSLTGTVAGLDGTCPSVTFTIGGTAVYTNATTQIGGGGTCTDLKNGDTRYVSGTKQSDGRVLATYVSGAVAPPPPPPPPPPPAPVTVTLNGILASLAGTCPSLTFTVAGTAVYTNASTQIGGGGTCTDLKNGDTRYVSGTRQSDGRVLATYVSGAVAPPPPPPPPPPVTVTLNGILASLAGTCPSLTFTVAGTAVYTNASTQIGGGGACTDLKNGDTRYVSGTRQSDGRVLATYVSGPAPH